VLATSRDGRFLAAGDNGGHVILHDARSGAVVSDTDLTAGISDVAFSPDGTRLAIGSFGRTSAVVYDVSNPRAPAPWSTEVASGVFPRVAFDADGRRLVVSGNDGGQVYDATSRAMTPVGAPLETQHGQADAVFVPRLGFVVSGADGSVTGWDPTGTPLIARVLASAPPSGGSFSPDGSRLVLVDNDDGAVLYRLPDLHRIASLSIKGRGSRAPVSTATPVAFSPDGRLLAIGDRFGDVQLFDARTGRARGAPIAVADGHLVQQLSFSPDGRTIATASFLDPVSGAHVVDVVTRRSHALDPAVPFALSTSFSPDGKELLVTSGAGGFVARYPVANHDVGRGRRVTTFGNQTEIAAFSPDGRIAAVGDIDGSLSLYDAGLRRRLGRPIPLSSSLPGSMAFSRDGRFILVQDTDAATHLIDVREQARVGDPIPGSGSTPVQYGFNGFAPDGSTMVMPTPRGSTIWTFDPAQWRRDACTLAGRDLTRSEWNHYFSAVGAYRSAC
jgi:WD40 repeat protein